MNKALKTKKDFSTGGVVWDEKKKKFLLILVENLSKERVWTFPKGHPEKGETERESALREVLEETGWVCEVIRQLNDTHYFYTHQETRFSKTVRWFLMKPLEETGTFDTEEVIETKWAGQKEAEALITYGSDKDLLKQTAVLL